MCNNQVHREMRLREKRKGKDKTEKKRIKEEERKEHEGARILSSYDRASSLRTKREKKKDKDRKRGERKRQAYELGCISSEDQNSENETATEQR